MKKTLLSLFAFSLLVFPGIAMAGLSTNDVGISGPSGIETGVGGGINLSSRDPIAVAISLINWIISFLAFGAVVILLIGGFKWMTAMGNDDNIKKAKSMMSAGIIGLVIILASWGIARFVVSKLATKI
ncbi:MAG: hypothetical protein NT165_02225 [Candidatus Falkowbacteria bacterium]|nr:hypothetical protein [Candidatus Falkowbacteria bacterium]